MLYPNYLVVSTAGAHPNPLWLSNLIKKRFEEFCGFDADETGDALADKMIALHPSVKKTAPEEARLERCVEAGLKPGSRVPDAAMAVNDRLNLVEQKWFNFDERYRLPSILTQNRPFWPI